MPDATADIRSGIERLSTKDALNAIAGPSHPVNLAITGEWDDAVKDYNGPALSQRAMEPELNFIGAEKLDTIFRTTYDPVSNPDGKINLGIAENSLLVNEYLEYFGGVLKDHLTPVDLSYGNQASGSRRLHQAIADLWNENFAPIEPVHPDHIISGPGATGVLDQLVSMLLNPGEAIMIAAPHYNGFDVNMVSRSRIKVEHVKIPAAQAFDPSSLDYFEDSIQDCKARGVKVGAMLLCSPQNPFGRTYDKATLLAYATFAEKHDLHLISDELYALSVYDNPDHPNLPDFTSMLALDIEKETGKPFNKGRLHIVYSFSKDFGMNGFRVAAIISQHNNLLLRSLYHIAFLMKVSSPADVLISALLNDKPKFKELTSLNRKRLAEAASYVSEWFKARGMTPFPANAGHFVMIDGTQKLGIKTFEEELAFSRHCASHGVFVGIGQVYHAHEPGWLRVTFSVDRHTLETALGRLDKALAAWKSQL